ncbi:MAG: hypothetical protein WCI67_18095 [Chloroflexales bacterium]
MIRHTGTDFASSLAAAALRVGVRQRHLCNSPGRLAALRANIIAILDLAAQLKPHTIDAIMARSDLELGLEALLGTATPRGRRKKP